MKYLAHFIVLASLLPAASEFVHTLVVVVQGFQQYFLTL